MPARPRRRIRRQHNDESCVLLTNSHGVILDVDARFTAVFGYAREEAVFTNVIRLLHPDELHKILRRRESPSLWGVADAVLQMVRKDKTVIMVEARTALIHKNKQALILRDVTERMRAEETIQAANKRMLDILDSISDSFMVLDLGWRFKYINPRAATLVGLPTDQILGRIIWERFPRLIGTLFERNYRRAMEERTSVLFEAESPEGRWIEVRVYPTTEGLTIYGTDVTPRKRAEERLRFAIESARLMILEWTNEHGEKRLAPDGDGKHTIPLQQNWASSLEPIHPGDRARVAEERRRATERGGDSTLEFRLLQPDGTHLWVSDRLRVTRGRDGEIARITDVFVDITDRKRLEEELAELRRVVTHRGPPNDGTMT